MYDVLEHEIIPMYYDSRDKWISVMKRSMQDIAISFDSARMASEYYEKLYNGENMLGAHRELGNRVEANTASVPI